MLIKKKIKKCSDYGMYNFTVRKYQVLKNALI